MVRRLCRRVRHVYLEDAPPAFELDDDANVLGAAKRRLGVRKDSRPRRLGRTAAASRGREDESARAAASTRTIVQASGRAISRADHRSHLPETRQRIAPVRHGAGRPYWRSSRSRSRR